MKYEENAHLKDENYIVYNGEYQNKNFYTPYFVDSDYIFEYDDTKKTQYDYSDLTDNKYFRQDDYIDVQKQYTDNILNPGTYSHTLSSKVNGTQFYFVKDNQAKDNILHSVIITRKEDQNNNAGVIKPSDSTNTPINNNLSQSLTTVNSNNESNNKLLAIEDRLEKKEYKNISKEGQVKAIRKGLTDNMIMNDTFLASLDLNSTGDGKTMLALKAKEDEVKG